MWFEGNAKGNFINENSLTMNSGIQVSVLHCAKAGQGMTAAETSAKLVAGGSYAAEGCTTEKQAPAAQPNIKV